MSIAPKQPKKLTIVLEQQTRCLLPSHYPLSADCVKEPQLIVKAVYVSSLTVITQSGITKQGKWKMGGLTAISMLLHSEHLVMHGSSCINSKQWINLNLCKCVEPITYTVYSEACGKF